MKKFYLVAIALVLALSSCKEDKSMNPDLVGRWQTPGAIYTFSSDEKYAIEYVNDGESYAPVADSVFGIIGHDNKRNTITFFQQGYRVDSSQVILYKELNGGVWSYSINGDELTYESKTQTGLLKKLAN